MNDEETYRELVRTTLLHKDHFASYLKFSPSDRDRRRRVWLRLLGLIDTWYNT